MSKERLEEINNFDVEREMKHLKDIVEKDDRITITSRFVKYLIEQSEREQELEELKKAFDELDSSYVDLQEQNKRYRDLLKKIKEMTRYDDCREAEIYELVSDELEGEE